MDGKTYYYPYLTISLLTLVNIIFLRAIGG
jgi:hypothetical protein